ncbi:MAG: enolase C-terminal domain-like protein, partial [Bacteroidota bacterium]
MLKLEIKPYTLQFKFNAKTSRGTLNERLVWFLKIRNSSGIEGVGEVAPIHRLSFEDIDLIPSELEKLQKELLRYNTPRNNKAVLDLVDQLVDQSFSSIRMGLEMALLDLMREGEKAIFPADLSKLLIPVNGLVWMGDRDFMEQQIRQKLEEGYQCIKLKIGSLDFQTELAIVKALRNISDDLVIRLDANGAFPTNEVLAKL